MAYTSLPPIFSSRLPRQPAANSGKPLRQKKGPGGTPQTTATAPPPNHAQDIARRKAAHTPAPKSIHEELNHLLEAYSLFRPKNSVAFDLFHILYLHGNEHPRDNSIEVTSANLQTICDNMRENLQRWGQSQPLDNITLDRLCEQMTKTEDEVDINDTGYGFATASSLERSFTAAGSLAVNNIFSMGGEVGRSHNDTHEFSVTVKRSKRYKGGNELRKLIWRNGEVIFAKILEELDSDLDVVVGERRLLAIVTKKIIADINISCQKSDSSVFRLHGGGPDGTVNGNVSLEGSEMEHNGTVCDAGIAGIHYLLFPMERLNDYKFRFRPGTNVIKPMEDDPNGTNADTFSVYKRWQQGADDNCESSNGPCRYASFNNCSGMRAHCPADCLHRARSEPTPETNSIHNAGAFRHIGSQDDMVDPQWTDVRPRLNGLPCIEVDLAPMLNDFAMRQCQLAARYREQANGGDSEVKNGQYRAKCAALLRSALRKCCYESTVSALLDLAGCYQSGIGVLREQDTAAVIRICASALRTVHESRRIWDLLLSEKTSFSREAKPEKRIIQMMIISVPRAGIRQGLTLGTASVILATRILMQFCVFRGYWYMLLPEKLPFCVESESGRPVIHLLVMSRQRITLIQLSYEGKAMLAKVAATSYVGFCRLYPILVPKQRMDNENLSPNAVSFGGAPVVKTLTTSNDRGIGDMILRYIVKKVIGKLGWKSSKGRPQPHAGMRLISSTVDMFGRSIKLQEKIGTGVFYGVRGRKHASSSYTAELRSARRFKVTVFNDGTLPIRSMYRSNRTLQDMLQQEDSLVQSSTIAGRRRRCNWPRSESSVTNEGTPHVVDSRRVRSERLSLFSPEEIPPFSLPAARYRRE